MRAALVKKSQSACRPSQWQIRKKNPFIMFNQSLTLMNMIMKFT